MPPRSVPPRTAECARERAEDDGADTGVGADAVAPSPVLTLSARTAAEAAHGALREAVGDLGRLVDDGAAGAPGTYPASTGEPLIAARIAPDRWVAEDGPLGRLYAGDHCLTDDERGAWEEGEFARERAAERVDVAVGAYARALRREGVGLPAALVAVRATVADAAALLPAPAQAALQRDAAACCLAAFYAH